jgi:hypothetical protein
MAKVIVNVPAFSFTVEDNFQNADDAEYSDTIIEQVQELSIDKFTVELAPDSEWDTIEDSNTVE